MITATSDSQKTSSEGWLTSAEGFTVIWNVSGTPKQLMPLYVNSGVTIIVATWGIVLILVAVHEYVVVPIVFVVKKLMSVVESPAHTICETIGSTCADGFTVIVKDLEAPVQVTEPFVNVGVTIIFATCGMPVELSAVNELISPDPLEADNPIVTLSLVQS